jgi:hypothetical protein
VKFVVIYVEINKEDFLNSNPSPDTVIANKSRRMLWHGHVERMERLKMYKEIRSEILKENLGVGG